MAGYGRQVLAQFHRRDRQAPAGQRDRGLAGAAADLRHPVARIEPGQPQQVVEKFVRADGAGAVEVPGREAEPGPQDVPRGVIHETMIA